MFVIHFDKYLFMLYLFVLNTSWTLNFFIIKNLNLRYLEQQERYNDLVNKLSDSILIEIENTNDEINNLENTYISNFKADVDQLQKRGERILINMNQASEERYNFYLNKRDYCSNEIKKLIDSILS